MTTNKTKYTLEELLAKGDTLGHQSKELTGRNILVHGENEILPLADLFDLTEEDKLWFNGPPVGSEVI